MIPHVLFDWFPTRWFTHTLPLMWCVMWTTCELLLRNSLPSCRNHSRNIPRLLITRLITPVTDNLEYNVRSFRFVRSVPFRSLLFYLIKPMAIEFVRISLSLSPSLSLYLSIRQRVHKYGSRSIVVCPFSSAFMLPFWFVENDRRLAVWTTTHNSKTPLFLSKQNKNKNKNNETKLVCISITGGANAVTWGVFPGKEILQPTVRTYVFPGICVLCEFCFVLFCFVCLSLSVSQSLCVW